MFYGYLVAECLVDSIFEIINIHLCHDPWFPLSSHEKFISVCVNDYGKIFILFFLFTSIYMKKNYERLQKFDHYQH